MYTKDKSHRITLRLNEDQFEFVKESADRYDVSPSEFLRMVVNSTMFTAKEGCERRENEQTNSNNQF